MSDILSVYSAKGVIIPPHRLIRLTGNRNQGLWEVDLPKVAYVRTHCVALPGPSGSITDKIFGQARTFGPVVDVELETDVDFDSELCVSPDGRGRKAHLADKNRNGIALAKMAKGAICPVMLGWSQFP